MFNKYFELASTNNTGESLAFVVAEIAFKVAVVTYAVTKIRFLWVRSRLKLAISGISF